MLTYTSFEPAVTAMNFAILITNYNKLSTIEDAINSSLTQKANIYVVDDCSTDKSYEKISKFANITLLQTATNSGPSVATKLGADRIVESHTILLDGDDVLCPNAVAYFEHILNTHEVDAIYTTAARDRSIDLRNEVTPANPHSKYEYIENPLDRYLLKQFAGTCLCIKTELLKSCLISDIFVQDIALAANLARNADSIIISSASTHYCSPTSPISITSDGLLMWKNIVYVYLYFRQFPEVKNNRYFPKYARRIYGSLPPLSTQYNWLTPKWKKRVIRWYRRYFMIKLDQERITTDMQYFLDNADQYFNKIDNPD